MASFTTADQAFVWVADSRSSFVYSYQRQADGKLTHSQRYGYLHCPDAESESIADGMTIDEEGRLYVATKLGVQILDQLGRVHLILPNPHPEKKKLSNVAFGGPELDTLFVTCTDKVYKRRLKTKGVVPSRGPAPVSKPGPINRNYHFTSVSAICSSSFTIDQLSSSGKREIPARKEFMSGCGREHRAAILLCHVHADAEIFVHRSNLTARAFECAIHDELGTICQEWATGHHSP